MKNEDSFNLKNDYINAGSHNMNGGTGEEDEEWGDLPSINLKQAEKEIHQKLSDSDNEDDWGVQTGKKKESDEIYQT